MSQPLAERGRARAKAAGCTYMAETEEEQLRRALEASLQDVGGESEEQLLERVLAESKREAEEKEKVRKAEEEEKARIKAEEEAKAKAEADRLKEEEADL